MKTEQRSYQPNIAPGLDKVTRYNWTIRNAPGEFLMIPKTELEVDPAYKRNRINQRRADALTRAWDWIACGCLIVALRDDNKWFILDGQHRKLAADQRSDIRELPCLVFETTNRREEALGFLAINLGRVGVDSLDRYRAQLLSGDMTASAVEAMLRSTGHRAGEKPSARTVSCVQCLYNLAYEDRARFERLWPLLAELHPDSPMTDLEICRAHRLSGCARRHYCSGLPLAGQSTAGSTICLAPGQGERRTTSRCCAGTRTRNWASSADNSPPHRPSGECGGFLQARVGVKVKSMSHRLSTAVFARCPRTAAPEPAPVPAPGGTAH